MSPGGSPPLDDIVNLLRSRHVAPNDFVNSFVFGWDLQLGEPAPRALRARGRARLCSGGPIWSFWAPRIMRRPKLDHN